MEAVHIFSLLGDKERKDDPAFQRLAGHHATMLAAYRQQDWQTARAELSQCRALDGALGELYDLYEERLGDYEATPPGPEWDGVYVATSK